MRPLLSKRGRLLLAAGLPLALLIWALVRPVPEDPGLQPMLSDEVLLGTIPGHGPMVLQLLPGRDMRGSAFRQQDGESFFLAGAEDDSSVVRVALVLKKPESTNGWLTLPWQSRQVPFLEGTWVPAGGQSPQPVRFQRVGTLWTRGRYSLSSVAQSGVRITEWTEYPVFPQPWRMQTITETLNRKWWRPAPEERVSRLHGQWWQLEAMVSPETFEVVDVSRVTEVLLVSEPLVVLATIAGTQNTWASSAQRETWNFVREDGRFRRFALAELFRPNTPWVERLFSLCVPELQQQAPDWVELHHLSAEQMRQFVVLPAGLLLRFDPFADPTEDGSHVMIPWARLQDVLEPTGPARFFLKNTKGSGLK